MGYIAFLHLHDKRKTGQQDKFRIFDYLLTLGIINLISDAVTAYTVNHLDTVPGWFNTLAHLIFLLSIDALIFGMYLYILVTTDGYPKSKILRRVIFLPFVLNVFLVVVNMGSLEYRIGKTTNYSMGPSAYTCFAMVAVYFIMTLATIIWKWRSIEKNKRASIVLYLLGISVISTYQAIFPEVLLTGLGFTVLILGVYINQEDSSVRELDNYHHEMVMGFATLVEKRDNSTGEHVRRTSQYVELLAKELRDRGYYRSVLTKDYLKNLRMAAPMHDIGKISVPDAILQKSGKLTDEEYATMRDHTVRGGRIIKETFGNLKNDLYMEIAYQVATYHHEKWDGTGYPAGLKGEEIPLSARIMTIADVFDAISEERCYREALSMDTCFEIIEEGKGTAFEPLLVDVFLSIRKEVEKIHGSI